LFDKIKLPRKDQEDNSAMKTYFTTHERIWAFILLLHTNMLTFMPPQALLTLAKNVAVLVESS